jgi:hypothetical protein
MPKNGPKNSVEKRWEVEAVVGKKMVEGSLHYRIKWLNFPEKDNTWEPAVNIVSEIRNRILRSFKLYRFTGTPAASHQGV